MKFFERFKRGSSMATEEGTKPQVTINLNVPESKSIEEIIALADPEKALRIRLAIENAKNHAMASNIAKMRLQLEASFPSTYMSKEARETSKESAKKHIKSYARMASNYWLDAAQMCREVVERKNREDAFNDLALSAGIIPIDKEIDNPFDDEDDQ